MYDEKTSLLKITILFYSFLVFSIEIYTNLFFNKMQSDKNGGEEIQSLKVYFFHVRLSCSAMASKKSWVLRYMPSFTLESPWMQPAKSFVIFPDSTVSIHAFSSACEKRVKSALLSNLARCSRPVD